MKRLLIILLLLCATPSFAGDEHLAWMSAPMVGAGVSTACVNDASCASSTSSKCGTTYLLCEDFDGAVKCEADMSGAPSTCRVEWTEVGTDPTFNYSTSPAPLEGTYSLYLNGQAGSGCSVKRAFTAGDTINVFFSFNAHLVYSTGSGNILELLDGSNNIVAYVANDVTTFKISCGGAGVKGTATIVADTTYYIWFVYTKGSGSNAVCSVYYSTNTTKPGAPEATKTNGTSTAQAAQALFRSVNSTDDFDQIVIDYIRVNDADIGSSPP